MAVNIKSETKPLGLVWIDCPYPAISLGLAQALEPGAEVHTGPRPPIGAELSLIVVCPDGVEDLEQEVDLAHRSYPGAPIVVFGLGLDLPLAQAALEAGARGFVHAGMPPQQILRAAAAVRGGELAAPRQLLEHVLANGEAQEPPAALSARQREILELVSKGLSNAQIAQRVFLSESTVKQHLGAAFKVLGVRNRAGAAQRMRQRRIGARNA